MTTIDLFNRDSVRYAGPLTLGPTGHLPEWVQRSDKLNTACQKLIAKGWGVNVVHDEIRCSHTQDSACRNVTLKKAQQLQLTYDEFQRCGGEL